MKKAKGVVLLEAFLALMLMAMASYGMASVNSVAFSQLSAISDAYQAKNYAEMEAQYLKQLGYDDVVNTNRDDNEPSRPPRHPDGNNSTDDKFANAREMTKFLGSTEGARWKSTATLGEAITNIGGDSDNNIQNVVISVYKTSDGGGASPRATVTVPLSSQGSGSGGEAVGTIVPRYNANFVSESEAKKYLFCDGGTYDTSKYPKLYKVLGTNILPNLNDRVLQGSSTGGTYKEAGLPNITGGVHGYAIGSDEVPYKYMGSDNRWHNAYCSGAMDISGPTTSQYLNRKTGVNEVNGFSVYDNITFDASLSNSIYGNSTTVQPPAMTVRFYIRAK